MEPFRELTALLDPRRPVLIQTHDFPDHDALGAAYALCELLLRKNFTCSITYGGAIQSISLAEMISRLEIPLISLANAIEDASWQTIMVDGSAAAGTVKESGGTLLGIIDHHPQRKKTDCPFLDIRTNVGACSSIVWSYWKETGETPDKTTATALLAGIQLDTNFLSRKVSVTDLEAHYCLFFQGDPNLARDIVNTSLSVDQLADIGKAFRTVKIKGYVLLAEVHGNYVAELLSVLADFLLRLREITFAAVIEVKGEEYHLSARSRDKYIDAGHVVRKILTGIGSGGGHPHMAGGSIPKDSYPGAETLLEKMASEAEKNRSKNEAHDQAN